jgi:hypothetical protein
MSQDAATDAKIRLLRCDVCKTLEEIPDFDGPPEYDVILEVTLARHKTPEGHPHIGRLIDVPQRAWEIPGLRKTLLEQIQAGGSKGAAEFDAEFYNVQNTFRDDAMACYSLHNKPKGACPDFNSERKQLKPDTKTARADAGIGTKGMPIIHLCSFCPVRSFYDQKANEEKMRKGGL